MKILSTNKAKGNFGENLASKYLIKNNYLIIERNFRNKIGEVDIIANKEDTIVFIEVKARSSLRYGYPYEAVNKRKQQKLKMLAVSYVKMRNLEEKQIRFDIIEVYLRNSSINHIQNAFCD